MRLIINWLPGTIHCVLNIYVLIVFFCKIFLSVDGLVWDGGNSNALHWRCCSLALCTLIRAAESFAECDMISVGERTYSRTSLLFLTSSQFVINQHLSNMQIPVTCVSFVSFHLGTITIFFILSPCPLYFYLHCFCHYIFHLCVFIIYTSFTVFWEITITIFRAQKAYSAYAAPMGSQR